MSQIPTQFLIQKIYLYSFIIQLVFFLKIKIQVAFLVGYITLSYLAIPSLRLYSQIQFIENRK